jgi:anti-sigma factor RsiW
MIDRHCRQIFAALSDYLDGELPVKSCRELERHLKGCKPCIAFLESLKTTVEACRRYGQTEMPSPRPEMTPELQARLLKSLRAGSVRAKAL